MKEQMKQQIAADFEKAKSAGGARMERIRQIFKDALTQTVTEMKAGTGEIGSIAKGSTSSLIDTLKQKPEAAQSPATVEVKPVEVKPLAVEIEDGDVEPTGDVGPTMEPTTEPAARMEPAVKYAIVDVADATVEIQPTPEIALPIDTTPVTDAHSVAYSVTDEIVHMETAEQTASGTAQTMAESLRVVIERLLQDVKQSETYASLQQQVAKLKERLAGLDQKLTERYGERYEAVKQDFRDDAARIKTWYEGEKSATATTGTTWVEQKQADLEGKFNQAGATIAQKEQKIKQQLKSLWQNTASK